MMSSAEIREAFLKFFESKKHLIVPSASIVIKDDPTLMFTNAGMNQFKDYFLGNLKPTSTRIVDTQKCLRVSGKHNDLEEVGVDTYHHTMFEMLGNWSFGEYFKKEAIAWSWELLTEIYKIDKTRLYVSVFEGDASEILPSDEEAENEWKKYIDADRIIKGNKKDNFWEMGDTGPCGPCTEIHVDCRNDEERSKIEGKTLVNNNHPQVIEIWNNVFIQYNRKKDKTLEILPAKHVDTGMGLERLVRILQQKNSNYDTDIFMPTILETEKITGKQYEFGDNKKDISFRVIADHIRAISFCIADGQLPSNTGAGYVIRRILRRAVRYYFSNLNYKQPLLMQLVPLIANQFEFVFPELKKQADFVSKVIKEEENAFLRTLDKGLKRLDDILTTPTNHNSISGAAAFELYDTYGFPLDLTKLIATENNFTVDDAGFNFEMQQQKKRSRDAGDLDTQDWVELSSGINQFVGYTTLESNTKILKYRKVTSKGKDSFQLILETTPFYAESGGQIGDSGTITFDKDATEYKINNTKKENELIIHFIDRLPISNNENILAKVDVEKRKEITAHHSATHLLHAALRNILGSHVVQKGSLVNQEHLRFDFSHFAKVGTNELNKIEAMVNKKIRENIAVNIKQMPKEEALKLGAMALFGEKYGNQVRVVIIDPTYSIELCGGTHVASTGEIGYFKILHESAVAAGVRRIEAVAGTAAENHLLKWHDELEEIKLKLKNPIDAIKALDSLQDENQHLKNHIAVLEARQLVQIRNQLLLKDELIENVTFIGEIVEISNQDSLKKLCLDLSHHLHDCFIVLCANIDGKPFVAISISETVCSAKKLNASTIIKEKIAPIILGGGGGQKTLATAGGQNITNLPMVINTCRNILMV